MGEHQCFQLFDLSPQLEYSQHSFFTQRQNGFFYMQDLEEINIFFKDDERSQLAQKQLQIVCQRSETLSVSHSSMSEVFPEKRKRKRVDRPLIDYSNLSGRKKALKKKQKSSIFHNYQKHLIVGLKNMLRPQLYNFPNGLQHVANDLWISFLKNSRQAKKITKFIFFDKKNTELSNDEVVNSGFEEVYHTYSRNELLQARVEWSKLASMQLTKNNIDEYLSRRRIKDSLKFKQYLTIFLQNLQKNLTENEEIRNITIEQLSKQ